MIGLHRYRPGPAFRRAPGFTMIEILILVALVAALTAIAIPNLRNARVRSNLAQAQADLRTLCGWPLDQAEVLATGERLTDRWTVIGVIVEERDARLNERRVWLHGARFGRRAWLLDHTHGGRGFEGLWLPGSGKDLTLVFYPGGAPLRALVADEAPSTEPASTEAAAGVTPQAWSTEWERVAQRIAAQRSEPWQTRDQPPGD